MAKRTKKRHVAAKRKTAKRKVAKRNTATTAPRPSRDEVAFTETVIETGKAARLDKDGKLPAGATHKIVEDEAGNLRVVRRRFSIT